MVVIHGYMMIIMLSDHELVFTFISAHVVHHINILVMLYTGHQTQYI